MALLRRLTDEGRTAFRAWIETGGTGEPPRDLLSATNTSDALKHSCIVDAMNFETRLACGKHLRDRLATLPLRELRFDEGVWDWLSLFYIDQLLPTTDGIRKPQEIVRYCLQLDGRKWSRHFIRMNWAAVQEHGEHARIMLSAPMYRHPDILEQLSAQQEVFGSKGVIAAADRLYWDVALGAPKRGHATRTAAGVVQRLRTVMRQFELTWDLEQLVAGQVIALLPGEFDRWKPANTTKSMAAIDLQPTL